MNKRELESYVTELPMLPNSLVKLMALNPSDDKFFENFESICKQEPALTIKVLQLSNSSLYGTRHKILDIKEAIIRLGISTLSNIFSTLAVTKVFVPSFENEKRLWLHSIEVAFLAEEISKNILQLDVDWQHKVYTCGLLHDIGLFVQFAVEPQLINLIDGFNWETPLEHIEAESKVFDIPHTELGLILGQKWSLPTLTEYCIKYHHQYELPESVKEKKSVYHVIRLIQLADFISEYFYHHDSENSEGGLHEELNKFPCLESWAKANVGFNELYTVSKEALDHAKEIYTAINF